MIKFSRLKHLYCFSLFNLFIIIFFSYNYIKYLSTVNFILIDWFYLLVASIGQYFLIVFLISLILIPFLIINKKNLRALIICSISTFFIMLMVADVLVFERYRFHLNLMFVEFYLAGQLIELPTIVYFQLFILLLAVFFIEYFLFNYIQKRIKLFKKKYIIYSSILLIFCLLSSHLMHIWADQYMASNITRVTKYIPAYYPFTARNLLYKLGVISDDLFVRKEKLKISEGSNLDYPKNKLIYKETDLKYDIIYIVIDSWRYDTFSHEITPNIFKFSKNGLVFNNHKSTGNATRSGLFGIFYGIPSTYWLSFLNEAKPPVFIDRLLDLNYKFGIYSSAQIIRPEFNQTIFSQIPNLRLKSKSETVEERDIEITNDWINWYKNLKSNEHSFSFLFYDASHAYAVPKNYSYKFQPFTEKLNHLEFDEGYDRSPLFNRYKTSVHFIDSLVGEVIKEIEIKGKLDSTVIIITSDHGEEFNDNGDNFWGHNSNFTDVQIKVPFIFISPSDSLFNKEWFLERPLTTHEDISPTILKNFLGNLNQTSDFSTGRDLMDSVSYKEWSIVNSYHTYAIVYDKFIIEFYPNGVFEIFDKKNKKIDTKIDFDKISLVFDDLSLFNK